MKCPATRPGILHFAGDFRLLPRIHTAMQRKFASIAMLIEHGLWQLFSYY
jgi:hypothetical protein